WMGWFSKILKGSSHRVSEGRYDWRYGEETVSDQPSTSRTPSSSETEDVERAIALSISEKDRRGNSDPDREMQSEEDELLARALQESLNVESPRDQTNQKDRDAAIHGYEAAFGYGIHPPHPSFSVLISKPFRRMCAGCNSEIDHGRFLSCMNGIWHPECLRCHCCRLPIYDYEFLLYGNFPYHKACYKESHHPKCDVCHQFIPINAAGLIEYRAHPFWSQKYCPSHEHDGTTRCCSCERMESLDTKFASLNDGRSLCLECLDSAFMDTVECQPLYLDIQEFYEGLNMKITQQIPLLLVERQALNEAMDGERNGHFHMPEVRGVCLSEEQTVRTILRRPRSGEHVRTEPYKLRRQCEVTAILVLYGLPRLLTGSILAHEMMHAWMRLNGFRTLRPDIEEGICQVMASMWLEYEIMNMS
ncbi:hypothetical protein M569_06406, partial [Genlisea aurea]